MCPSETEPRVAPPVEPAASLVAAPPPPAHADPARLASYVRAAMHQDRTPGELLVVLHPKRRVRVPSDLFDALRRAGWGVHVVETRADRVASVTAIRDAFVTLQGTRRPLDVLVIAGDGTLDHHLLMGAFWACTPDLVRYREGEIAVAAATDGDRAAAPRALREVLLAPPDVRGLAADEATVKRIWSLQLALEDDARAGVPLKRLAARVGLAEDDPALRVALWCVLAPERVRLRPHGFDLEGLARATQEETFQGLYPFVRSFVMYPAGTASDNAMFAGVPGWFYAQTAAWLSRWRALGPLRRLLAARARRRFVRFFTSASAVVPARFSLVQLDGSWQAVCSHAVGGPGSGHLFAVDLAGKSHGLLGYMALLPRLIVREGVFGSTLLQVTARAADGRVRSRTESQLAEALYTNRTFIAGLGSIPSTEPTSFAGRSTFVVAPPIVARGWDGSRELRLSGLLTVFEGAAKGILGRLLHLVGLDPGRLAGGGKLASAWPEHQLTLREGESIALGFRARDGRPRRVPTQVSGDPYVCSDMEIRVAWGPLPLLAAERSQLLASARRTLDSLRVRETWKLESVVIGGLVTYRRDLGTRWSRDLSDRTGLFVPPLHLHGTLARIQEELLGRWQELGTGPFVDTSRPGFQLGRRGRYAHNGDQSAHLVVLREEVGTLLVRQVRADGQGRIYESQTRYGGAGSLWIIRHAQTRVMEGGGLPTIVQETWFSRSPEALERDAPSFFPTGR